jgi:hypothetical protein
LIKGIRLSPKDPRLFIWLPALAGAHYQLRHYAEAVERECLPRLPAIKVPNLAFVEGTMERLFYDRASVDHILDGLRKAGFQ